MRDKFSTLDIVKVLEIPRERLRSWMKEGFVQPTVPAQGQGTKAVFSRYDIYSISLFDNLLDAGFRREVAASHMREFAKVFHKNYELVLCRQVTLPGGCMMHCSPIIVTGNNTFAVMSGEASFSGGAGGSHEMTEAMKSINDISQWDTFLVVNIGKLKSKVDTLLSQLD
jgi:MerR HTH family regulatory protein